MAGATSEHAEVEKLVAVIEETTPGTYETLTDASASARVEQDAKISFKPIIHERDHASLSSARTAPLLGTRLGTLTYSFELAGAGNAATTYPAWSPLLCACGWQQVTDAEMISCTSPGDLIPGELCTQASTGATAYYIKQISSTNVLVGPITGAEDNSNVWTGAVSSETFTATAVGTANTHCAIHRPDPSVIAFSAGIYNKYSSDMSTMSSIYASRGDYTIAASGAGGKVMVSCNLEGVARDVEDATTLSPTYDDYTLGAFMGAGFSMEQTSGTGAHEDQLEIDGFSISGGASLEARPSANAASGVRTFRRRKPTPTGTIEPELTDVSGGANDHNFWDDLNGQTQNVMYFTIGSGTGNVVEFHAGNVRYTEYNEGERVGLTTVGLPFGFYQVGEQTATEMFILTM